MDGKVVARRCRQDELKHNSHTTIPAISRHEYEASGAWGLYTSIDGFECNSEKIAGRDYLEQYTAQLCRILEVTRHGDPQMVLFGNDPSIYGWSMSQMIETSIITGHFIQMPRTAYVDIFSCKFYDALDAIRFTCDFFEAKTVTYHSILSRREGMYSVDAFKSREASASRSLGGE